MTALLFPDNTVLINFAYIKRVDLLKRLTNGNGAWCVTVATECATSAGFPGLESLSDVPEIFGIPLHPDTGAEYLAVQLMRIELARPGDDRRKHLGEAETLAIMTSRSIDGGFVTDDREATRLAAKHGIPVYSTWDLLRLAFKVKFVDADTLWGYIQTLWARDRGGPPAVVSRATFDAWLT